MPAGALLGGEGEGTNPEELIGAALSGRFSMALTVGLEQAGLQPRGVKTSADVTLDKHILAEALRKRV